MINNAGYKLLGQAVELQLDTSSRVFSPDRIPGVFKGSFHLQESTWESWRRHEARLFSHVLGLGQKEQPGCTDAFLASVFAAPFVMVTSRRLTKWVIVFAVWQGRIMEFREPDALPSPHEQS